MSLIRENDPRIVRSNVPNGLTKNLRGIRFLHIDLEGMFKYFAYCEAVEE